MQLAATVQSCWMLQGEGHSRESRGNSDKLSSPPTPTPADGGSSLAAPVLFWLYVVREVRRIGVCVCIYVSLYIVILQPNPSLSNSSSWIYSSPLVAVEEKQWLKTGHCCSLRANHGCAAVQRLGSCACELT